MKKFQNKPLFLIVSVCLIIVIFFAFKAVSDVTTLGLYSILQIPNKIFSSVVRTGYELLHFKSIASENFRLHRELTAMTAKAAALGEASSENKRLKELLTVKDKLPGRSVVSRVIGRDYSNWAENLVIDKGFKDGVREGMAALADGAVIGKVTAAGQSNARISLITDPEIRVPVVIQRSRAGGLLYGIARGRAIIKFIPKNADIKAGDLIVTSGISGVYPKGFLVGKVLDVKEELNKLYQFALVEPAADSTSIEEVLVIE